MPPDIRGRNPSTNLDETPSTWEQPTPEQEVIRGNLPYKPTEGHDGRSYRVEVRDLSKFGNVRIEDVDGRGHVQRLSGQQGGGWDTVAFLINKEDAHVEDGRLVGDSDVAREVLSELEVNPVAVGDGRFTAHGAAGSDHGARQAHEARRHADDPQLQKQQGRGQRR